MELKKLLILSLFSLAACGHDARLNITGMPNAPEGPPEYVEGWEAGCRTGMSAYSGNHLKYRYKVDVDGARMTNVLYNRGWELGQSYCSYYTSAYTGSREFTKADWRGGSTWFKVENTDGFFSYAWNQ